MRIYELVFIIRPDLPEDEINAAADLVQQAIEEGGAKIDKVDKWGKKRLAYKVQKHSEGHYFLIQYSLDENLGLPKEVERRMGVSDAVIKYLTIRIDEDLKRLAKLKVRREARAARRPASSAPSRPAAPAKPAAPAAAVPGAPPKDAPAKAEAAPSEPAASKPDASKPAAGSASSPEADKKTEA